MNKQEIEAKIKYVESGISTLSNSLEIQEKELADLQAELEQVGKRWRAKEGGYYYCLASDGVVMECYENYTKSSGYRYNTGNYFEMIAEANEYKKALLMVQECECEIKINTWNFGTGYEFIPTVSFQTFKDCDKAEEFAKLLKLLFKVKGE